MSSVQERIEMGLFTIDTGAWKLPDLIGKFALPALLDHQHL
jgi:hypothetical protein